MLLFWASETLIAINAKMNVILIFILFVFNYIEWRSSRT
jgi:hypothetical protein